MTVSPTARLDHPDRQAADHCRSLLLNLMHSLVVRHLPSYDAEMCMQSYRHVELVLQFLRSRQGELVWPDTPTLLVATGTGAEGASDHRIELDLVIDSLLTGLLAVRDLREEWGAVALRWAGSNPAEVSTTTIVRSHHIFRWVPALKRRPVGRLDRVDRLFSATTHSHPIFRSEDRLSLAFCRLFSSPFPGISPPFHRLSTAFSPPFLDSSLPCSGGYRRGSICR